MSRRVSDCRELSIMVVFSSQSLFSKAENWCSVKTIQKRFEKAHQPTITRCGIRATHTHTWSGEIRITRVCYDHLPILSRAIFFELLISPASPNVEQNLDGHMVQCFQRKTPPRLVGYEVQMALWPFSRST